MNWTSWLICVKIIYLVDDVLGLVWLGDDELDKDELTVVLLLITFEL